MGLDWNINPLVFLEFAVVLAFGIGWFILERVTKRFDKPPPGDRDDTRAG